MPQPQFTGLGKTIPAIFFILFILFLSIPFSVLSSDNELRNDLIRIQLSDTLSVRQMPAAVFLHDNHTKALTDKDCSVCHMTEKNQLAFKFNRLKDGTYDADRKMYHEKCIGCHQERREQGKESGPMTIECRSCHFQNPPYQDSARPFGFDKSLHYRHEIAEAIPPTKDETGDEKDWNCGACHHEYDKERNQTVYVKGKEGTCRYCHKAQTSDEARSFQTVAHEACLNCHFKLKALNKKAGPTDCSGCHAADRQAAIQRLEDIPRIRRNQPDHLLLSLWLKDAVRTGEPSRQFISPVAFSHKSHEAATESCYVCHHASMDPCITCHTRIGSEKSASIRLEKAMHSQRSMAGCKGCHLEQMKDKNCSGCHSQMPQKFLPENDCTGCHSIQAALLKPVPADPKLISAIAEAEIASRKAHWSLVSETEIPETVTIDIMKDQYEGATFPHRKITQTLSAGAQKSRLASHFHGTEQTLCAGCHHHSPLSLTPPRCASCHGLSATPDPDGRPGLKGAYHGQCIRCHQEMGIQKPAATDCAACHKPKTGPDQRTSGVDIKGQAP